MVSVKRTYCRHQCCVPADRLSVARGHMIASSLIHAVIYVVIWCVMRHFTLPEDIALAVVVIVAMALFGRIRRPRYRRRW